MIGIARGLRDGGADLAAADLLSGTSAGACVATQVATEAIDEAAERQRRKSAEIIVPFDIDEFLAQIARAREEEPDEAAALVRIAAMAPLGPEIGQDEREAVIAARLPLLEWPSTRRLVVNAVDADSGELVGFERDSGVALLDAVSASCALPGCWPPLHVDGRRYVDGGVRSLSNADAARGHDVVAILVPTAISDSVREHLDTEIAALGSARTLIVAADEDSLAAIGPNPLDPERREPALEAGERQAGAHLAALAEVWV